MMAILAIGGKFLACNQECSNILGYSNDELLSMESCYDIFSLDSIPKAVRAREEYITQGKPFRNLELQLIKKDKTKLDVLCNLSAIEDPRNKYLRTFAVWRECTELVQAREKLKQHNENLSLFLHTLSHDLSAPLRGITLVTELLQEQLNKNEKEDSQETCATLFKRIEHLHTYFHDIRTYLIGSKSTIEETVNTGDMIATILKLLVKPKGFKIIIDPRMPTFNTLKIHLQQVFYNLITNAITHHPNPEVGLIHIKVQEFNDSYHFSIIDNGPALTKQDQEKIFQHLKFPLEVQKSGFGLAIVKKILDQVGGKLYIFSENNVSNKFTFTWPKHIPLR